MGDKGGDDYSDRASKLAKKLYKDTVPIRRELIPGWQNFLQGDYDVSSNPVYGAGKSQIESQYDVARQNILSNLPSGGQLNEALVDTDVRRADALGGLAAQIAQDEYNKIYGFATGSPQASLSSMTSLAGSQAAAQAQETAGKYGAVGDIGGGLGMMFGMKGD